jgi:AraC family transcriptional regulator, melibiose operon regulatory protein
MTVNSFYDDRLIKEDFQAQFKAFYFVEWNNFHMNFQHKHDQVEIMYVINGKCRVEIEKNSTNLNKGDFILIDADIPHALIVENDFKCRMLNIEFSFIKKSNSLTSIRNLVLNVEMVKDMLKMQKPYLIIKDSDEVYSCLKNLIIELNKKNTNNDFLLQLLFSEIIIYISKMVCDINRNNSVVNIHVNKALSFINKNYEKDIKLADIAKQVNINESYLQRIFKIHTGHTIVDHITFLRLDKAKMLLSNTGIPIIDISNYIGINSRQYFTFLFKKRFGTSPAQFRKSTLINSSIK